MTGCPPALASNGANSRGTPLVVVGEVVSGDARGRTLGFPTANLVLADDHPGRDGVWAGWVVDQAGTRWLAAISVGRRTTFYDRTGVRLLEAHLLDFSGDLYGQTISTEIVELLRPQRRFRGVEALLSQLEVDIANTRAWAAGSPRADVKSA